MPEPGTGLFETEAPDTGGERQPPFGEGDHLVLAEHQASPPLDLADEDHHALTAPGIKDVLGVDYNRDGRIRIHSGSHVGLLGLPSGFQIEVRPKLAGDALLPLVLYAYDIPPEALPVEASFAAGDTILDLLAALYLHELRRVLKRGLATEYVEHQGRESYLRGRWNLDRQLRRGPMPSAEFDFDHEELTADNPLNRTILYAAHVLSGITKRSSLADRLDGLVDRLQKRVQLTPVEPATLTHIHLDRLTEYYASILELAGLVIRHVHVGELRAGPRRGRSLLVDMAELWEKALERAVRETVQDRPGWSVHTQDPSWNLLRGSPRIKLRPDIIVRRDGEIVLVADAKWKRARKNSDVYQIVAYQLAHDCDGALLYPGQGGALANSYEVRATGQRAELVEVPVTCSNRPVRARWIERFLA